MTGAALTGGYSVEVDGRVMRADVTGKTCGIAGVAPGIHEVAVVATGADGAPRRSSRVVVVSARAVVTAALEL